MFLYQEAIFLWQKVLLWHWYTINVSFRIDEKFFWKLNEFGPVQFDSPQFPQETFPTFTDYINNIIYHGEDWTEAWEGKPWPRTPLKGFSIQNEETRISQC